MLHDPLLYELDVVLWRTSADDEVKHPLTLILEALAGAWVLMLVIYTVQFVMDHARDRRR